MWPLCCTICGLFSQHQWKVGFWAATGRGFARGFRGSGRPVALPVLQRACRPICCLGVFAPSEHQGRPERVSFDPWLRWTSAGLQHCECRIAVVDPVQQVEASSLALLKGSSALKGRVRVLVKQKGFGRLTGPTIFSHQSGPEGGK